MQARMPSSSSKHSLPPASFYNRILLDLDAVGWEHIVSLSEGLTSMQLSARLRLVWIGKSVSSISCSSCCLRVSVIFGIDCTCLASVFLLVILLLHQFVRHSCLARLLFSGVSLQKIKLLHEINSLVTRGWT